MAHSAKSPTKQQQLALRSARALACYTETSDNQALLLVGWPVTVLKGAPGVAWESVRAVAQADLNALLAPLGMGITLAHEPVRCETLHAQAQGAGMEEWLTIAQAGTQWPGADAPRAPALGPYVWVGLVQADLSAREVLQSLFFEVGPGATELTRALSPALETRLTEGGTRVKFFSLTAFWNSLSLARLTHAKLMLRELDARGLDWETHRMGANLVVTEGGTRVMAFEFPEETDSDLSGLGVSRMAKRRR